MPLRPPLLELWLWCPSPPPVADGGTLRVEHRLRSDAHAQVFAAPGVVGLTSGEELELRGRFVIARSSADLVFGDGVRPASARRGRAVVRRLVALARACSAAYGAILCERDLESPEQLLIGGASLQDYFLSAAVFSADFCQRLCREHGGTLREVDGGWIILSHVALGASRGDQARRAPGGGLGREIGQELVARFGVTS